MGYGENRAARKLALRIRLSRTAARNHERRANGIMERLAAMTEQQIKHMVERFLGWKLPENFSPDAGISFTKTFNDHMPQPMKHEPMGTNLFDATQAEAMVRYMVKYLPMNFNYVS